MTNTIYKAAQAEMKRTGIPASIQIGQYALESGWGKRMPPGSNNPFGMKTRAGKNDPFVSITTKEWSRLRGYYNVVQNFRKFDSIAAAFTAHADLLLQPVYAKARAKLPDVDAFADALTSVYATDPNYGKSLRAVIHGSNLLQYDKL